MNNLVHKHSIVINKAKTEEDRKQKSKKGYVKHKGKSINFDSSFLLG